MKVVLVLVLVLVLDLASALASPLVKPPAGWTGGADDHLVHVQGSLPHFGDVHGIIEAESYKPSSAGTVLYVSRIAATTAAKDLAARAEIDSLHPTGLGGERETSWSERFDPATKQVEVNQTVRDPSTNLTTTSRAVLAATADRVVIAKGECLAAGDADPKVVGACTEALATLDTGVDAKDRVPIDLDVKTSTSTSTSTSTTPEKVPHVPLPPMAVPHEEPRTDLRPVVVGAALLLMAAFFWWNHRRRSKIDPK